MSADPSTEDLTLSDKQSEMVVPLPPIKRIALDEDDTSERIEMYKTLLADCEVVSAQRLCDSFSRVRVTGNIYSCSSNCGVSAKWLNGEHRTGRVQRFLTNDVVIKQGQGKRRELTFVLAEDAWFMSRPENRSTGILSLGSMVFGFFTSVIHSSANNSQSVFNSAIQS